TTASHAKQIETIGARRLAAEAHKLAVRQRKFDTEKIVRRKPVFQAMQPTGVFRDVAADGARDLTRWIGRIIEAVLFNRTRDREIGDTRLGHNAAILKIDLQNSIHPRQAEQDSIGARQCPARKRSAAA